MADNDDKTVKQLLDAGTRADLERWFGLPSFEQLADEGKLPAPPTETPETAAARKRRDDAIAAVDPRLVDSIARRAASRSELIKAAPSLEVHVDPSIARLDLSMIERQHAHLEPRQVEIPSALEDDLRDCTPQALLRDLHRPVEMFDKVLEWSDPLGEERVDVTKVVAEAMTTRHRLVLGPLPFQAASVLMRELRALRRQPWTEIKFPSRGTS